MVSIIKTGLKPQIGRGILAQPEILKLLSFCKKFDVLDGDLKPDSPYVFDVRPEAIHLLDKVTKEIMTSMYLDRNKGNISIEVQAEEGKDVNPDPLIQQWAAVITDALR
jgi:hypothetical protein